ncbi:hypothetical protein BAUCODRAFT_31091 [Baudoinia panamericana UAMH 10762]|uniref:Uncharacterized protein n=1 Tax=Baudoinia panamericana (strain UAMH 10762) TaxID=717646 RepID=M2N4A9_BAUPA|nr:uncharacterized protein BAUCODRAFT_31091 [Baudoinia panamericana UAMH 10762]EMC98828.1 hypothetical protein BAUCODRAFT_31091 [Baudoinia panamericana UAMH 10762]
MQALPSGTVGQENNIAEEQKPRRTLLGMRGGGLILDLCACFICCECMEGEHGRANIPGAIIS